MAGQTTYIENLSYEGYTENAGGGFKVQCAFEGVDGEGYGCFLNGATWPVDMSGSEGPKVRVLDANGNTIQGLTAKITSTEAIGGGAYQGTLDIYPLNSGTITITYYDESEQEIGEIEFEIYNDPTNVKNLASGVLVNSVSASATSLVVNVGSGTDAEIKGVWPDTPFYITVIPANPSASVPNSLDSEIMRVSVLNASDGIVNMAVSRGQRGTTAKAFSAGDIVSNAVYAEDAVLLGEEVSPKRPLYDKDGNQVYPDVGQLVGDDIADGAITSAKIADGTIASVDIADNAITTAKIADGQITTDKLKGFSTANTTDSWVPVSSNGELQHRVIKAFNADGSIPASALASNAVETAKIKDGAVTNAKIASSTIETGKIKWSTLKYNFTATTDGNGFMVVPTSVVKPATGFIIAARKVGTQMFTNIFSDTQGGGRFTIQCETWDHQKIGNTSVNLDILYVLVS